MEKYDLNHWDNDREADFQTNIEDKDTGLTEEEISAIKNEAHECWPEMWYGADRTIQSFLSFVENGENCYCILNWRRVYSIDLINMSKQQRCDLENAFYLVFFWKTKIEKKAESEKYKQEVKAKERKFKALEKILWWVEEGKHYIDESKWREWEEFVEYAARGDYYWEEVELVLKLLKMIDNWDSRQNIQEIFDNEWDDAFMYIVIRNKVVYFSKKWEEADKNLVKY